jgi:PAP2 superfamily
LLPSGEYNHSIVRRLLTRIDDGLPQGWLDALRQVSMFALAYGFYESVRGIADSSRADALANGAAVIDFERSIGSLFEPNLQQALVGHRWLVDIANFMYINTHFVVTVGFLVWLYLYRNDSFYFVRNMFMVAMGLALLGYTLMPTAPPRMFPGDGFVDTITTYAGVEHDKGLFSFLINPYAAIPSMHIAFALMIAVPGMLLARRTVTRVFWCAYPLLVFFVIVFTANHFWVDAAAGALVAAFSALAAAMVLARARPAVWSWRPAEA